VAHDNGHSSSVGALPRKSLVNVHRTTTV
jgi:hypothetical protein